jgi:hypothetical protein
LTSTDGESRVAKVKLSDPAEISALLDRATDEA